MIEYLKFSKALPLENIPALLITANYYSFEILLFLFNLHSGITVLLNKNNTGCLFWY